MRNHLLLRLLPFGVISTHTYSTPSIPPARRNRSLTLHDPHPQLAYHLARRHTLLGR
ncbi:hypothetical protein CY34DRAFT_814301 [Suillus luteus UH-Slu-Lm8-n1]|uniref:Uncharacterized protein n=1 Tax=Suillus luteus UH-Slu-Lm8-n1 TaxID=930992 RepID=A0A0C9Z4R9_9AGAM|nr:hypothetical protein CY34DRAFT_814301 [Suillus luteus UH-Slu-Lm8-n1]